jgi:hypothetical protein
MVKIAKRSFGPFKLEMAILGCFWKNKVKDFQELIISINSDLLQESKGLHITCSRML